MPIYEYECSNCGNVEEVFQKMSDAPLEICPQCQGHLSKIISHSSFHLKGSGWYVTDYGGKTSSKDSSTPVQKQTKKTSDACSGTTPGASSSNSQNKK